MGKLSYNEKLCMQTLREQGLGAKAIIFCYLTKGRSWALLRKSAVESTALAQPFCVNQAVDVLTYVDSEKQRTVEISFFLSIPVVTDVFLCGPPLSSGDKVEFNTVEFVESRLLPKPATNRQQSRLSPYTVDFVAGFGNKSATTWIRQLVAVYIVANSIDFVARMSNVLSTLSPVCTGLQEAAMWFLRLRLCVCPCP